MASVITWPDTSPEAQRRSIAVDRAERYCKFAPEWVYPRSAQIARHIVPYPRSVDLSRLCRVKEDLALYWLTFGQPRQEGILDLLRHPGVVHKPELLRELGLNLAPPSEARWPEAKPREDSSLGGEYGAA